MKNIFGLKKNYWSDEEDVNPSWGWRRNSAPCTHPHSRRSIHTRDVIFASSSSSAYLLTYSQYLLRSIYIQFGFELLLTNNCVVHIHTVIAQYHLLLLYNVHARCNKCKSDISDASRAVRRTTYGYWIVWFCLALIEDTQKKMVLVF